MVTIAGSRRKDLDGQALKVPCSSPRDPVWKKGREEGGREEGRERERKDGKRKGSGGK